MVTRLVNSAMSWRLVLSCLHWLSPGVGLEVVVGFLGEVKEVLAPLVMVDIVVEEALTEDLQSREVRLEEVEWTNLRNLKRDFTIQFVKCQST